MSFCFLYNVVLENHSVQNSPRGGGGSIASSRSKGAIYKFVANRMQYSQCEDHTHSLVCDYAVMPEFLFTSTIYGKINGQTSWMHMLVCAVAVHTCGKNFFS